MQRPSRFEHTRYLGDKRTQIVYDLDAVTNEPATSETVISELAASSHGQTFGPDTLAEARNRGYRLAQI